MQETYEIQKAEITVLCLPIIGLTTATIDLEPLMRQGIRVLVRTQREKKGGISTKAITSGIVY